MLPTDSKTRKGIPIYRGFVRNFPDAMAAVAQLSRLSNDKHNPGSDDIIWNKDVSMDELDCLMRHMVDDVSVLRDRDGALHAVKIAWRGMANLQRLADNGVDIFAYLPTEGEESEQS